MFVFTGKSIQENYSKNISPLSYKWNKNQRTYCFFFESVFTVRLISLRNETNLDNPFFKNRFCPTQSGTQAGLKYHTGCLDFEPS